MKSDRYLTLDAPVMAEYRDKSSKFLGFAFPVQDKHTVMLELASLREMHPKANHHCYAYRMGVEGAVHRANDDGEPAGTAGRPILNQLVSFGLNHVLVVIVRYFGGIKLGVPGLISAYKETTRLTLDQGHFVEGIHYAKGSVETEYQALPAVLQVGKKHHWEVLSVAYKETGQVITFRIPACTWNPLEEDLLIQAGGLYPDEVAGGKKSETLIIKSIDIDA
jgi:uncharacterized YigZ family protein